MTDEKSHTNPKPGKRRNRCRKSQGVVEKRRQDVSKKKIKKKKQEKGKRVPGEVGD